VISLDQPQEEFHHVSYLLKEERFDRNTVW